MKFQFFVLSAVLAFLCSCMKKEQSQSIPDDVIETEKGVTNKLFGVTSSGKEVDIYTLTNAQGMEVDIITLGGIITKLTTPDRDGNYQNVVLGFDNLKDYEDEHPFFGALVGRYGNRIAQGKFELDGEVYQLPLNNGENHLHGGDQGFDKKIWTVTNSGVNGDRTFITLNYLSKDMEMGYPGNLDVAVTYDLSDENRITITYVATTDKPTICNLTQHSYFNLTGDFTKDILDHRLAIIADHYIPVDEGLIPTGQIAPVIGTPFDFRAPKGIGENINAEDVQINRGGGYDHCYVINGEGYRDAAFLYEPQSGRIMQVFTDEPGVQLYTGNFLDNTLPKPGGGTYGHRSGFCLETQHFPDSPNQAGFPSTVLRPGEYYRSKTAYQFYAR